MVVVKTRVDCRLQALLCGGRERAPAVSLLAQALQGRLCRRGRGLQVVQLAGPLLGQELLAAQVRRLCLP